jgi:hypothetical protein
MRLSSLQKFVLIQSIQSRRSFVPRHDFRLFYAKLTNPPKLEDQQNSITKSLERMIDKGLLIGFGRRTPEKWFIDTIKLTPLGRRIAKTLDGEQQRLPLRLHPRRKKT